MSDNLPPDFRDDMRDHYPRCASLCDYADHVFDTEAALELFMDAAAYASWLYPRKSVPLRPERVLSIKKFLVQAADLVECPLGHRDHSCNCEDIANSGDPWDEGDGG